MSQLGLGLGNQFSAGKLTIYDADALTYINAVQAADGQSLENGVKVAINDFVVGCKADGIWDAIVASCIMAGARTVAGAIVPLKGNAPTNNNFVIGDYNRKLGLLGDGTTKYLATGYNNNDTTNFPQNDSHISCYVSQSPTNDNGIFVGTRLVALNSILTIRYTVGGTSTFFHCRGTSAASRTLTALGFQCASRSSSTEFLTRCTYSGGTSDATSIIVSSAPSNNLFGVFAGFNGTTPQSFSNPRLSFYSIGKSLSIPSLDSRVTTLMTTLASVLP
jgi:hypothetical protein